MKRTLSTAAKGGAAPLPNPGQPVGLLEIPAIGLEKVVVEGTAARRLKAGPGRDPASAFPGRAGRHADPRAAQLVRQAVRAARPPAHRRRIVLTTGLGRFRLRRRRRRPPAQPGSKRSTLTLATSSPALLSSGVETVVARARRPAAARRAGSRPAETVDPAARRRLLPRPRRDRRRRSSGPRCSSACCSSPPGRYRRSPWLAWLLTTPIVVALLFCLLGSLDRLLPVTR